MRRTMGRVRDGLPVSNIPVTACATEGKLWGIIIGVATVIAEEGDSVVPVWVVGAVVTVGGIFPLRRHAS